MPEPKKKPSKNPLKRISSLLARPPGKQSPAVQRGIDARKPAIKRGEDIRRGPIKRGEEGRAKHLNKNRKKK